MCLGPLKSDIRAPGQPRVAMATGISEAWVLWGRVLRLRKEAALAEVEIIARVERRRKWMAEEKAALLAEVEAER
jgi:hypothetical protein